MDDRIIKKDKSNGKIF